jgi:hypothetical protein
MNTETKMRMPGFTAEVVLNRPARTYGNDGATYRSAGLDARVEPARIWDMMLSSHICYRECVNECNTYGLDTPAHCANDCYLGCYVADD